ncbi:hypothetical protein ACPWT1_13590 [Ramlibacter sp. MMS24-I3-19]|uniref:hypothetical protein n=1 Tax=Ramlibacter sp. MMS24-I3-19 TaxID=3416606 RepID=UPI003D03609D
MKPTHAVLAAMLVLGTGQAMACYLVYDRNNQVVYSGDAAPVDMSKPLHEALAAKYPGGHMTFDNARDCPSQGRLRVASTNGKSPLLVDIRTAKSMGLPYTDMGNGVAMVRERPDSMRTGVNLAESGLPRDDTRAMGAAPAQPQQNHQQAQQKPAAARPAQPATSR